MQPFLPLLGIDRGCGVGRVRHTEQIENERQIVPVGLIHPQQPFGNLRAGFLGTVGIGDPVISAPQFQHRQHRDCLAVRHPVGFQHRKTARPAAIDELRAQPRLAGAGVGHHADDLTAAVRPLQRGFQDRHIRCPADESGQAAGTGTVEACAQRSDALQVEDADRFDHALDLNTATIA